MAIIRTPIVDRRFGKSGLWIFAFLPGIAALFSGFWASMNLAVTELLPNVNQPEIMGAGVFIIITVAAIFYLLLGVARVAYESLSVVQRIRSEADRIEVRTYSRRVFDFHPSDIRSIGRIGGPSLWLSLSLLSRDDENVEIELLTGRKFHVSGSVDGVPRFFDQIRCDETPANIPIATE